MTLTEFLLARIAEDEAWAQEAIDLSTFGETTAWRWVRIYSRGSSSFYDGAPSPARVLAECEAKRRIVEFHESWPVLVESQPEFTHDSGDIASMTFRMTKQIAWTTEREYRNRFGAEPPTAPMLRVLGAVYADHPDYDETWRP